MQLIKAFKTETVINGMVKTVLVSFETDHDDFDGSYMESDDVASIERKIELGQMDVVWFKVTARFADLEHFEGVDSLGQVFVTKVSDLDETASDYDMVKNAIEDLKTNVLQGVSQIETFLGKAA